MINPVILIVAFNPKTKHLIDLVTPASPLIQKDAFSQGQFLHANFEFRRPITFDNKNPSNGKRQGHLWKSKRYSRLHKKGTHSGAFSMFYGEWVYFKVKSDVSSRYTTA